MNDPVRRQDFDKAMATLKSTVQRVFPTDTRRPGRTVSTVQYGGGPGRGHGGGRGRGRGNNRGHVIDGVPKYYKGVDLTDPFRYISKDEWNKLLMTFVIRFVSIQEERGS